MHYKSRSMDTVLKAEHLSELRDNTKLLKKIKPSCFEIILDFFSSFCIKNWKKPCYSYSKWDMKFMTWGHTGPQFLSWKLMSVRTLPHTVDKIKFTDIWLSQGTILLPASLHGNHVFFSWPQDQWATWRRWEQWDKSCTVFERKKGNSVFGVLRLLLIQGSI